MRSKSSPFCVNATFSLAIVIVLVLTILILPVAAQTEDRGAKLSVQIKAQEGSEIDLYDESHALVIGVSHYTNGWPSLSGVIRDLTEVSAVLKNHGFQVEILTNPARVDFDQALRKFIANWGQAENNRLLIYFAGHGHTLKTIDGRQLGYLVPSDAPLPGKEISAFKEKSIGLSDLEIRALHRGIGAFKEKAISMSEIEVYALQIESKHVLFVFDSCFSGSLFGPTRGMPDVIASKLARPVRQFITAGTAEQLVPDDSIFRAEFVEGLNGEADLNKDGYITGTELSIFLEEKVTNYSKQAQTPQYGKIKDPKLDKGDFIFVVPRQKKGQSKNFPDRLNLLSNKYSSSVPAFLSVTTHLPYRPADQGKEKQEKASNAAQENNDTRELIAGKSVERTINGDELHSYQIALITGQYLNAVVDQRGIDIVITLSGPDGKRIMQVDSPNGSQGSEPVSLIADTTGNYRMDVQSLSKATTPGRYEIRVVELRPATSDDRALLGAIKQDQEVERLYSMGKYDEAIPLAQGILTVREKALGQEHPDVAKSLNRLAAIYAELGDYAKAEPLYMRSLVIQEKMLGPEHPDVAQSLNNLADLYYSKGDFARAEPLYMRSLAIQEKMLGPEHPDVAQSLNNLAVLYHSKGDFARAEPLYMRSLAIQEKMLGPTQLSVAVSLNNLASLYYSKQDYDRAEGLVQRALMIQEKALGPDHPSIARSLNNLAAIKRAKGDDSKAEPLYQRALAISEKALGPDHPNVAIDLNNLGEFYYLKRDYAKAESLYRRSLTIRQKTLGLTHPHVAQSLNNLAKLYNARGKSQESLDYFNQALMVIHSVGDHRSEAQTLDNIGQVYQSLGDKQKALDYFNQALAIFRAVRDHRSEAQTLDNIGQVYQSLGDKQKALDYFNQASRLRQTLKP